MILCSNSVGLTTEHKQMLTFLEPALLPLPLPLPPLPPQQKQRLFSTYSRTSEISFAAVEEEMAAS